MYNIQNSSGKNVALMLERGGYVMRPGKYLDLDTMCSRKWILANYDIKRLLQTQMLRLVHDSEQVIPAHPVKPITRYVTPAGDTRVISTKAVEVLDLSEHPDVEIDELGRVHTPEVVAEKPVVAFSSVPLPNIGDVVIRNYPLSEVVPSESVVAEPEKMQEVIRAEALSEEPEKEGPLVPIPEARKSDPVDPVDAAFSYRSKKNKHHMYRSADKGK
jgi:hypothetical protein